MRIENRHCSIILLFALAGLSVVAVLLIYSQYYSAKILDRSPLTDWPCAPPCWRGITPGAEMTVQQVEQVLAGVRSVRDVKVSGGAVRFTWRWWPGGHARLRSAIGSLYGWPNYVRVDRGMIQDVGLRLDFDLSVESVLAKFGSPPAVEVVRVQTPDDPGVLVFLDYPEQGIFFELEALSYFDEPVLEPTTRIKSVRYSEPQAFDAWVSESSQLDGFRYHEWPGYGSVRHLEAG